MGQGLLIFFQSIFNMKTGVLLVNLGSPASTSVADVKTYLDEFLMDERVIDVPYLLRAFLVRGIILRTRPKRSAEAYSRIWTKEGSPLVVTSKNVEKKLRSLVSVPLSLGMRYGKPSIEDGIKDLLQQDPSIEKIFLIPLYPHYALASSETVIVKTKDILKQQFPHILLSVQAPFYKEPHYLNALEKSIQPYLKQNFDHYLFSYHGIPYRHLRKTDATKNHCTKTNDCCNVSSVAHETCYQHQIKQTTALLAEKLQIPKDKYSITFQSRLKGDSWLQPYTDYAFKELPQRGVKRLAVVCPAFVSDCLETLEEIAMEGKHSFLEHGGEYFVQIPCLNEQEEWINTLKHYIENNT